MKYKAKKSTKARKSAMDRLEKSAKQITGEPASPSEGAPMYRPVLDTNTVYRRSILPEVVRTKR